MVVFLSVRRPWPASVTASPPDAFSSFGPFLATSSTSPQVPGFAMKHQVKSFAKKGLHHRIQNRAIFVIGSAALASM